MKLLERAMGILSDLFGSGRRKDESQDATITALSARVEVLESNPAGQDYSGQITALQDALASLAGRVATVENAEATDTVARAAATAATAAVADAVTTMSAMEARLAAIEAEFAALPTPDDEGGVVVPPINP